MIIHYDDFIIRIVLSVQSSKTLKYGLFRVEARDYNAHFRLTILHIPWFLVHENSRLEYYGTLAKWPWTDLRQNLSSLNASHQQFQIGPGVEQDVLYHVAIMRAKTLALCDTGHRSFHVRAVQQFPKVLLSELPNGRQ
jgi:hypothetical protein